MRRQMMRRSRMRPPRAVVAVLSVVVLMGIAACGARGPAPATSPSTSTTASNNTPSANGATATTALPAGCPTSGSDVGLTSDTITLGTIADRTGPVSGLFAGAQQGANAFAAYLNSTGGLCGHKVIIDFADSGTNCSINQNDTSTLVKKVFAFVGSFSLYDGNGCGATVLKANPTVPDVHVALDPTAETLSNHFDLEPGELGYATGMYKYFKEKYGSKMEHVGTISEDIPSATEKQNAMVN